MARRQHIIRKEARPWKLDAALGRETGVALDHAVLHLNGAANGVDHAAEFDEDAISGSLDDATMMHCDGGID